MVDSSNKVVVLGGCGQMGQVIIDDLIHFSQFQEVVIADVNLDLAKVLERKYSTKRLVVKKCNLSDTDELVNLLNDAFLVINASPYKFNLKVMEACLRANCHYFDLGGLYHSTIEQLKLNDMFLQKQLTAILGIGAAPGVTNIMVAYLAKHFDSIDNVLISDGAKLLEAVDHPLLIPYSLDTILDEYCLDAMVFVNGVLVKTNALSGETLIDFGYPVGEAAGIYTLHSELATLPDYLAKKGVRNLSFRLALPVEMHEKFKLLVQLGLASKLNYQNQDLDLRLILNQLIGQLPVTNYLIPDCEVVLVEMSGIENKNFKKAKLLLKAFADEKFSAGALNTGIPPAIAAAMLKSGLIFQTGVFAPEGHIDENYFFAELGRRNLKIDFINEVNLN